MSWRDQFTNYAGRRYEVQGLQSELSSGGNRIYPIGYSLIKMIVQRGGWSEMQESKMWCGLFDRCRFEFIFIFFLIVSFISLTPPETRQKQNKTKQNKTEQVMLSIFSTSSANILCHLSYQMWWIYCVLRETNYYCFNMSI